MNRLAAILLLAPLLTQAADPVREPWNTSRLKGSPDPPSPYTVERVFPNIGFDQGLELLGGVGLGRFFVTERFGKIWSFREDGTSEHPDVFADLKALHPETHTLYNVAFHPRFREKNEVFVFYTVSDKSDDGSRIARFKLASLDPPAIDPTSEEILLTFHAGGHNGGHMLFGPDGFLYVSAGDMREPFPPDPMNTGQNLADLASSIIRIDVDHHSGTLPYAIPKDNPFVGRPGIRPEIYAYGLRNPWKMAFRPEMGDLLVGDVGWEMWEMLDRVTPGANFGWPIVEGPQPVRSTDPPGPTPILPPLLAYPHSEGASITGGYFWDSKDRLPELHGRSDRQFRPQ
jgi:glucose/arabinose dehydrogenase